MYEVGHPDWFATCSASRRRQLNLTIEDLKSAGGPTKPVVVQAESGKMTNPRPSTLAKFDTALRWKAGSAAEAYWKGRPPIPSGRTPYRTGAGSVSLPLGPVVDLLIAQRELHELHDGPGPITQKNLGDVLKRLDKALSSVAGAFVTDTLERNHGQNPRIVESTLAGLLDVSVDPKDPDREEKLYRRWLLGRDVADDDEMHKRFDQRLRARRRARP